MPLLGLLRSPTRASPLATFDCHRAGSSAFEFFQVLVNLRPPHAQHIDHIVRGALALERALGMQRQHQLTLVITGQQVEAQLASRSTVLRLQVSELYDDAVLGHPVNLNPPDNFSFKNPTSALTDLGTCGEYGRIK